MSAEQAVVIPILDVDRAMLIGAPPWTGQLPRPRRRAPGPGPAVRLRRLVRPARRHPRARLPHQRRIPVREQIVAAVITAITNAISESLNRLAKLEARLAYLLHNPVNQRRRVRIACTCGYHRRSRTATSTATRTVTGQKLHPG